MKSILKKLFGDPNAKVIQELEKTVAVINDLEPKMRVLTADQIKETNLSLKARFAAGETLDQLLPEGFALCREVARRTLGQRHYDVQLMGGMALHRGSIAEMRTGEGKTLTATLAAYLNTLSGKGVHIVTVNDYLAKRDAVWMGQIFDALGVTSGCINHEVAYKYDASFISPKAPEISLQNVADAAAKEDGGAMDVKRDETGSFLVEMDFLRPVPRPEAYQTDVLYGTNNEFGFDYLRDNMVTRMEDRSQRELNFAIIDEVDSILIDEARTPLIISAPTEEASETYYRFADIARKLQAPADYTIDEKLKAISLTEVGIERVEGMLNVPNLYSSGDHRLVHHLEQALRAEGLYKLDRDYIVKDGEVIIVDEFTGRLMQGRRYSDGLHQAIEAKENVVIQRESQTLATITFQNLFRLYNKLSGMTGTAATEAEEFSKIYKLDVVVMPTNKDNHRVDLPDRVYKNEISKFNAVVEEIKLRNAKGQPILVGTISIEKNELLSDALHKAGVPHEVLNAKNHEREGQIIAQAGKLGHVTIATNMAGRGVDIILGGNPQDKAEAEQIRAAGGLMVMGTERHESRRIDNQLRGRSGRQGDPGTTQFFVSLDDDLMRIFAGDRMKELMNRLGLPDDVPIENGMVSKSIESAQRRVEGHHFDTRKHLLEYDDVLNKHREAIYRKRNEILFLENTDQAKTKEIITDLLLRDFKQIVMSSTVVDEHGNLKSDEVKKRVETFLPIPEAALDHVFVDNASKLEQAETRTKIIEVLVNTGLDFFDNLKNHVESNVGPNSFVGLFKVLALRVIDMLWVEHLGTMEHLRTGIGLQGYGQRDPLVEYKREAYRMFNMLLSSVNSQILRSVFQVTIQREIPPVVEESLLDRRGIALVAPSKSEEGKTEQISEEVSSDKIGRNDLCHCGSGKKFKKCHGK